MTLTYTHDGMFVSAEPPASGAAAQFLDFDFGDISFDDVFGFGRRKLTGDSPHYLSASDAKQEARHLISCTHV